jgi:hypothetical protein
VEERADPRRGVVFVKLMMVSENAMTCGHVMYDPWPRISDDNLIIGGLLKSGRPELVMKIR